jgi:hypothetical protein
MMCVFCLSMCLLVTSGKEQQQQQQTNNGEDPLKVESGVCVCVCLWQPSERERALSTCCCKLF